MNKYLLLRDNKQTGPYTVEELVKKGLKPYDLVWLDGRSAAWRYPSEIDELKAFAPAVEEQPYDRFYKRSSSAQEHAIHAAQQQLGKQEQSHSVIEDISTQTITAQTDSQVQGATDQSVAAVVNIPKETEENRTVSQPLVKTGTGKVYVTLPAGFRQKQVVQQEAKNTPVQAVQAVLETQAEEEGVSKEAAQALEARAAALAKSIQAAAAAAAAQKQADLQAIQSGNKHSNVDVSTHTTHATSVQPTNFSSLINKHQQDETIPVVPMHNRSGKKDRLFMRGIVAACLLLGGVVIGMALTYSKSSGNQDALDQLVQKLQERDAQRQTVTPAPQPVEEVYPPANTADYADEIIPSAEEQSVLPEKSAERQLAIKEKEVSPPVINDPEGAINYQEKEPPVMKVTNAVVTRKAELRPVSDAEKAAAREKIYQMVQVAASPFQTGVLGGISNLYFTISNTSAFPLDQIELEVKYLGPEKRVVKVQRMIFSNIGANDQKTLEAPRTSRGVSIDYVVTKINSKALGLAHSGF